MIEPIEWNNRNPHELPSPFVRGPGERDLWLTLDSGGLSLLPCEEAEALSVIHELGCLPTIQLSETRLPVDYPHPLESDILVTYSTKILQHRHEPGIRQLNPRTPCEALKVLGLFLRSRDDYTWRANIRIKGRWVFYWALARHHLPEMWPYFSACLFASKNRKDDTAGVAQAVLERASRALQARDAIGFQFYAPQDDDTRSHMMYHFDYLTLLLSGAIDAQARIAHRTYNIAKPPEKYTSFHNNQFRNELREKGRDLHELIITKYDGLLTLLAGLRNTIHGASLVGMGSETRGRPQTSCIEIRDNLFREGSSRRPDLDDPEGWGLVHDGPMRMYEPYSFSVTLVQKCLVAINDIAGATEIEKLFHDGQSIPPPTPGAPRDVIFRDGDRLALLA